MCVLINQNCYNFLLILFILCGLKFQNFLLSCSSSSYLFLNCCLVMCSCLVNSLYMSINISYCCLNKSAWISVFFLSSKYQFYSMGKTGTREEGANNLKISVSANGARTLQKLNYRREANKLGRAIQIQQPSLIPISGSATWIKYDAIVFYQKRCNRALSCFFFLNIWNGMEVVSFSKPTRLL